MGLVYLPTFTIKNQPNVGILYIPYMDPMGISVASPLIDGFLFEGFYLGLWIELRWIRMPIVRVLQEMCDIKSIPIRDTTAGNLMINVITFVCDHCK